MDKKHRGKALKPLDGQPKKTTTAATEEKARGITYEDGQLMYREKCADLKLLPNALAQKRFAEQLMVAICKKSLRCAGLGIGARSVSVLTSILVHNPQIAYLDLSNNHLKDDGAMVLATFIAHDPSVIYFDLRSNNIGIDGCTNVFMALAENTHVTDLDMSAIGGRDRNRMGTNGAKMMANMLHRNQTLSSLNVACCGITGEESCTAIGMAMSQNEGLTSLDLTANGFQTVGAKCMFAPRNSFGHLVTIVLARNMIGDDASEAICKQIRASHVLRSLDLSENRLGRKFLNDLYDAMGKGTHLENLHLSNNKFRNCGGPLSLLIRDFGSLRHMDISHNELGPGGIEKIAAALGKNKHMLSLDLTDTDMRDAGAKDLAAELAGHPALQKLYMGENYISDEGGIAIGDALRDNVSLVVLVLQNNTLKDGTGNAIIDALDKNTTVSDIDVSYNDFGYEMHVRLVRVIENHKRTLNSNIGEIAEKKVRVLKAKERQLFTMRAQIIDTGNEIDEKSAQEKEKSDELAAFMEKSKTDIEESQKQLDEVGDRHDELTDAARMKTREMNALKIELDRRQAEATAEWQSLTVIRQQTQVRVARCETRRLEQSVKVDKKLSDTQMRLSDTRDRLRDVMREVLQAKQDMKEKEEAERYALASTMNKQKSTRKKPAPKKKGGKKKKGGAASGANELSLGDAGQSSMSLQNSLDQSLSTFGESGNIDQSQSTLGQSRDGLPFVSDLQSGTSANLPAVIE